MVDPALVAVLDGVEELQEDSLHHPIIEAVQATVQHRAEEVASRTVLEHDVHEVHVLVGFVELDDVGVVVDGEVRGDLASLEAPSSRLAAGLLEDLDGVLARLGRGRGSRRTVVDCSVHDAVGALTEPLGEADSPSAEVEGPATEVGEDGG